MGSRAAELRRATELKRRDVNKRLDAVAGKIGKAARAGGMNRAGVTDKDMGYQRILANIFNTQGAGVVGIREQAGAQVEAVGGKRGAGGKPLTLVERATVLHEGTEDGTIPSRPFLSATLAENQSKYLSKIRAMATEAITAGDFRTQFEKFLIVVASDVRQKILSGPWVPNAPSTIARKKSSKPLIDTGRLRASIDYAFVDELPDGAE